MSIQVGVQPASQEIGMGIFFLNNNNKKSTQGIMQGLGTRRLTHMSQKDKRQTRSLVDLKNNCQSIQVSGEH